MPLLAAPGCRPGAPGSRKAVLPTENHQTSLKTGELGGCVPGGGEGGVELSQLGKLTATGRHTPPPFLLRAGGSVPGPD